MNTFTKRFPNTPPEEVAREVRLQRLGAEYGLSPCVLDTDDATYITMERIENMSMADFYGESIEDFSPEHREEIWDILWILYSCAKVEYVDVTPHNFIEKDGRIWVVDYGHAKMVKRGNIDAWLLNTLSNEDGMIHEWNPEFL